MGSLDLFLMLLHKFNHAKSLEQIHLYVLIAVAVNLGGYPRGGVSRMQILATN